MIRKRIPTLTLALLIPLAGLVAACSSSAMGVTNQSAQPQPLATAPAPTLLPTPSPTADVSKAFLAALAGGRFSARISGQVQIGSLSAPVSGTYEANAGDVHQKLTIDLPGNPQTTESLTIDGVSYVLREGRWFQKPAGGGSDSSALTKAMLSVVDTGVVTRDGRQLHHLAPPAGTSIPLSTLGLTDAAGGTGTVSLDFYAADVGTPLAMAITARWTDVGSNLPSVMSVEFAFANVGGQIRIAPPGQVWTPFSSKRYGYSLAYPSDWEVKRGTRGHPDEFLSANVESLYAMRVPSGGYSLNAGVSSFVAGLRRASPTAKIVSNRATRIDGIKARRLEIAWTAKGQKYSSIVVIAVKGSYAYILQVYGLRGDLATLRVYMDGFADTFRIGSGRSSTPSG